MFNENNNLLLFEGDDISQIDLIDKVDDNKYFDNKLVREKAQMTLKYGTKIMKIDSIRSLDLKDSTFIN